MSFNLPDVFAKRFSNVCTILHDNLLKFIYFFVRSALNVVCIVSVGPGTSCISCSLFVWFNYLSANRNLAGNDPCCIDRPQLLASRPDPVREFRHWRSPVVYFEWKSNGKGKKQRIIILTMQKIARG